MKILRSNTSTLQKSKRVMALPEKEEIYLRLLLHCLLHLIFPVGAQHSSTTWSSKQLGEQGVQVEVSQLLENETPGLLRTHINMTFGGMLVPHM